MLVSAPIDQVLRRPASIKVLRELAEARQTAKHLNQDPWTFAVEWHSLRRIGCGPTLLRVLLHAGLVQQRLEVTEPEDPVRSFRNLKAPVIRPRGCFVLSELGEEWLESELSQPELSAGDQPPPVPAWDPLHRELRVGGTLARRFARPAPNLELILSAFEESGWPALLDDPLPPVRDVEPKLRLHDTIKRLNRCQSPHLVHFRGDGSGSAVRWELERFAQLHR